MISLTFWPIRRGSSTCMLGNPSRNRMRSVKRSAWFISSMDSLRHCLANSSKPQLFSSRKCSQYWLMAVSSLRRPLLRYSMTLASPCMVPSRCRGPSEPLVKPTLGHLTKRGNPSREKAAPAGSVSGRFGRKAALGVPMRRAVAVGAAGAAGLGAGAERVGEDGLDGARAAAAFGAAAKAAVDLLGVARKRLSGADGIADIVV